MDKNEALAIANNYISIVSKQIPVQSAFLFGSYAKGNNHESSDIDIALVFDQVEDIIDLQVKLMQIRWDDVLMIEPHPFRLTDFSPSNPIVAEISKYGIPLTLVAAWRSGKIEEDYGFCAIHNHFNTMQYNELSQLETCWFSYFLLIESTKDQGMNTWISPLSSNSGNLCKVL